MEKAKTDIMEKDCFFIKSAVILQINGNPCPIIYICAMTFLSPNNFIDYELLDCGDFLKLERFGNYITIRPEPQAVWNTQLTMKDWEQKAHVKFMPQSCSSGIW